MLGRHAVCLVLVCVALAAYSLVAQAGGGGDPETVERSRSPDSGKAANPYTGDPTAIEEGRRLWRKTGCYSCHGGRAEGGVGPSLTDDVWVYKPTDETLFNAISKGRSGTLMVSWEKELDPDQIWKVIAFIRSLYQGDPGKIIW